MRQKLASRVPFVTALALAALQASASSAQSFPGQVEAESKVSATVGGFTGALDIFDGFGYGLVSIGDVDGNGVDDLAAGAPFDDDGGLNRGAVWILFMESDGSVGAEQKISSVEGNLQSVLEDDARFGSAVAGLGDLDGDRIPDIVVGASSLDDGGMDRGGVWILFLRPNGRVRDSVFLPNPESQLGAAESDLDRFGISVAALGDYNGNTLVDLAVGATGDRGPVGLFPEGAIWIFELFPNGTVALSHKIDSESGNFPGSIEAGDAFGQSICSLGDIDGDDVGDIAVGAAGVEPVGLVWSMLLNPDGTTKSAVAIDDDTAAFQGALDPGDGLGGSLALLGDLDSNGLPEIACGTFSSDDGGDAKGGVWILFLDSNGVPTDATSISETTGGFATPLAPQDGFGFAVTGLGDINGDDVPDLGVSAAFDDDGGLNKGAIYILQLCGIAPAKATSYGCGLNPNDSLISLTGPPTVGSNLILGIDNPLGTQPAGSFGVVLLSGEPDPSYPCGTPAPGFGMSAPGSSGEFLVSLAAPDLLTVAFGQVPFGGPGMPVTAAAFVPTAPSFLGATYFAQGLMWDPGGPLEFGLTNALELRVGP